MISRPKRPQIIEDVDIDEFIDGVDNYVKDLNRYIDKLEKALERTLGYWDVLVQDCCENAVDCEFCPVHKLDKGEFICSKFSLRAVVMSDD